MNYRLAIEKEEKTETSLDECIGGVTDRKEENLDD
jgi:hypothetical protein